MVNIRREIALEIDDSPALLSVPEETIVVDTTSLLALPLVPLEVPSSPALPLVPLEVPSSPALLSVPEETIVWFSLTFSSPGSP